MGLPAGRDAHDPAQSTAHPSYDDVGGRVGQALLVVPMGDAGAVAVEGPEGEPGLGPLGQVRGQRFWRGRQRVESSPPAPALPLAPGAGVHGAGGGGQFRLDGGGDPPGVGFGERARGGASRTVGMRSGFVMADCRRRARVRANGGCGRWTRPPQRRVDGAQSNLAIGATRFTQSPSGASLIVAPVASNSVSSDRFHSGRSRESVSQVSSRLISSY